MGSEREREEGLLGGAPSGGAASTGGAAHSGGAPTGAVPTGAAPNGGAASPTPRGAKPDRRTFLRAAVGALLGGALAGCSDDPTGTGVPGDGAARLSARPHPPTALPQYGPHALGLGGARDGVLFVPGLYTPDTPMPLLVTLHGAGGNAGNWSGFHNACEARGLILLAIDSRGSTWDRVGGRFGPDVPFIDSALDYTFDRLAVDPERIALFGFSDGASYALSLGPSNGDLFTHLVAYSPGHAAPADEVFGEPRIFVSHGKSDPILSAMRTSTVIVPDLQAAGYDVTYVEFEGGHEVPSDIGTASLDWFLG